MRVGQGKHLIIYQAVRGKYLASIGEVRYLSHPHSPLGLAMEKRLPRNHQQTTNTIKYMNHNH